VCILGIAWLVYPYALMREAKKGGAVETMNNRDFRDLVRRMRSKQKEYFRTRSEEVLRESKELERSVDRELEKDGQMELFDDGGT